MFKTAGGAVPKRTDSEETRLAILDCALQLFREKGFDETTMRDIAAAAKLSLGAAYYYFSSKEAIVSAYYEYVQQEHAKRTRLLLTTAKGLRERLRGTLHAKIDIMHNDRRFLTALFRYGGDPNHPLSWFGSGTRDQRQQSTDLFAQVIDGERVPDDVHEALPVLLWTLHMGILLYFIFDSSAGQRRTRRLIDASVDFIVDAKRVAFSPLLRPVRRRVLTILNDAGLLI